jgi:hypothetical protein
MRTCLSERAGTFLVGKKDFKKKEGNPEGKIA